MLRAPGRVSVSAFIVLFFAGMMSLLVYREVLRPRWSPQYRALPITQPQDYWMGIFSGGQRVGFFNARVTPKQQDNRFGVHARLLAKLNLPLFGRMADLTIQGEGFRENITDHADFDFSLRSAGQVFRLEGKLDQGKLNAFVHAGDTVTPLNFDIGDQFLVSGGVSGLDLPPLHPGEEVFMKAFNPMTMKLDQAHITCTRQETITVAGEEVRTNVLETELGAIKTQAWVDEKQEVQRVVTPFGFTMERIDPKEAYAPTEPAEQADFVKNLAVQVTGLDPVRGAKHVRIRFGGVTPEAMPMSDALQTRDGGIYDLRTAEAPTGEGPPLPDEERAANLANDFMVETNHPEIQKTSKEIVGDAATDWDKANRIYGWVYGTLEKIAVLSVPTAVEVLREKQGDCNEHTVLFAALARAAGVPTRIAIGLVYSEDIGGFGYHAWPEVYVGRWIPMDPTLGQPIADATHLKLLNGGIGEWSRLVAYVGQAKIEVLAVES